VLLGSQIKSFRLHALGVSVAIDDTACYRWLRDRIREHARREGTTVGSSTCLLSGRDPRPAPASLENERAPRALSRALIDHLDRFEPPEEDEPHVTIRSVETCGRFLTRRRDCVKLDAEALRQCAFWGGSRTHSGGATHESRHIRTPGSAEKS